MCKLGSFVGIFFSLFFVVGRLLAVVAFQPKNINLDTTNMALILTPRVSSYRNEKLFHVGCSLSPIPVPHRCELIVACPIFRHIVAVYRSLVRFRIDDKMPYRAELRRYNLSMWWQRRSLSRTRAQHQSELPTKSPICGYLFVTIDAQTNAERRKKRKSNYGPAIKSHIEHGRASNDDGEECSKLFCSIVRAPRLAFGGWLRPHENKIKWKVHPITRYTL